MARTLITVPSNIQYNDVINIRVLIQHPMETGYRRGGDGVMLARNLIRQFNCKFESDGKTEAVFNAKLFAAIAANPYLSFYWRAISDGDLIFEWVGDNGFAQTQRRQIQVRR